MAHKDYDLTRAVICYAVACIREGDWQALRDLGIGSREAQALQGLTVSEMARLEERLTGHPMRIQLDRNSFWMIYEQVQSENERHGLKLELVRRDAPAALMDHLFDCSAREYAALRKSVGAPAATGRPRDPDEQVARQVWLAARARQLPDPTEWTAEHWMELAETTGQSLRDIWRLAQRWYGEDMDETCWDLRHRRRRAESRPLAEVG